jgi:hypothetical protein
MRVFLAIRQSRNKWKKVSVGCIDVMLEAKATLVTVTGTLSISQDQLEQLFSRLPESTALLIDAPTLKKVEGDGKPQRLA